MSDNPMRPRKGDLYIDLRNGEYAVKIRIEKAKRTPEKKAIIDDLITRAFAVLGAAERPAAEETR